MGKFVIKRRVNGEFQFNFKVGNGLVILTSEGYSSKSGCSNKSYWHADLTRIINDGHPRLVTYKFLTSPSASARKPRFFKARS